MYNTEKVKKPAGFISAYMHTSNPVFVSVGNGADPKQGYFKLDKNAICKEMHIKNLIVSEASVFMAKRMTPGASWGSGIGYLEVGTGVGTGTTQAPQAESISQSNLRLPLARKAITSWTYLDSNGNATASSTNIIQFTTVFNQTEAVGAIVEMGLFGGDATVVQGTGYMFNYKTFPVWNKGSDMQLTIVWQITF